MKKKMNKKKFLYIFLISIIPIFVVLYIFLSKQAWTPKETPIKVLTESTETIVLAGGCFWCTEAALQETSGVLDVVSGYAGGTEENLTYEEVYMEKTGHREAVKVWFDAEKIDREKVLEIFWQSIEPTNSEGQFSDIGFPYTTAIFYENEEEKLLAEKSKAEIQRLFSEPVATKILPFTTFYEAEEYHQDFYQKSSTRYILYKNGSGRNAYKKAVWEEILKEKDSEK